MIMQVHDELIFEVKSNIASDALEKIVTIMQNTLKLNIPLIVDAQKGNNWNEAH
jgi:DNA polymerase-1